MTWQTFNLVLCNQQRRGQWIGNNKVFESQQQGGGVQIFNNYVLAQLHPSLYEDSSISKSFRSRSFTIIPRLFWCGYLSTVWFVCLHLQLGSATETKIWHLRSREGTKIQQVLHICETCNWQSGKDLSLIFCPCFSVAFTFPKSTATSPFKNLGWACISCQFSQTSSVGQSKVLRTARLWAQFPYVPFTLELNSMIPVGSFQLRVFCRNSGMSDTNNRSTVPLPQHTQMVGKPFQQNCSARAGSYCQWTRVTWNPWASQIPDARKSGPEINAWEAREWENTSPQ